MRAKTGREVKKTVKKSLVDIAKSAVDRNKVKPSWFTKLDKSQQSEIMQICRMFISGELSGSMASITDALQAEGVQVTRDGIPDLVAKIRRGEIK